MIHYSGRVGKGYPVQKPYEPKAKKRQEDFWVNPEEIRARDTARRKARYARIEKEMKADPESKYHGMSTYSVKCHCACDKCKAAKKDYYYRQSQRRAMKKARDKEQEEG